MSFVQLANGATGTTTDSATLSGVAAGSTLVAFVWDGSTNSGATFSVSDAQGSYTVQGSQVTTTDFVTGAMYVLQNANSGSHTCTVTVTAGHSAFIVLCELTAPTSSAVAGTNQASQSSPGTGTDAISSGSVAASASATLIAMSADTSVVDVSKAPATGTGFSSQGTQADTVIGSSRIETKSISGATAATFTAVTGTDNFATLAIAIFEPSGGGTTVTPGAGSLTLTGQAPTAISPIILTPPAGALALVGQEPQLLKHLITAGDVGVLSYVGGDGLVGGLEPPQNTQPQPSEGALVLAGQHPTVVATTGGNVTVTPSAGALVLAGQTPTTLVSLSVSPGAGALALAGQAPSILVSLTASPGAGALTLAGQAPTLLQSVFRAPAAGALVLAGQAPVLLQDNIRAPGAGALTLAGQAPTLLQNVIAQPGAGALVLAGQVPAVLNGDAKVAQPGAGALTLAGQAPTVLAPITVAPGAGALVLAGQAPSLSVTANVIANPLTGALIFTGLAPTVSVSDNRTVNPGAGALVLAGAAPTIPIPSPTVTPDPGALVLEGLVPEILVSGDTLLSAKFIARRPNVRMKGLQPEPAQTPEPLAPEITNMPGTEAVVRKARGLDLGLITAPPAAPAPKPAVEVPPISVTVPAGAPPAAESPVAASPPAAPAPKPAPPAAPPAPATREDVRAELAQLHQQILESAKVRGEEMMMAIDSLTMRVGELQSQIEADIKARDLREKNMLRAKQITERLLGDLEK